MAARLKNKVFGLYRCTVLLSRRVVLQADDSFLSNKTVSRVAELPHSAGKYYFRLITLKMEQLGNSFELFTI